MSDVLITKVKQLIIDSLGLEDIGINDIEDNMALFDDEGLGLDSVDALELGLALQKHFDLKMENDSAALREHFFSAKTLADFIASKNH